MDYKISMSAASLYNLSFIILFVHLIEFLNKLCNLTSLKEYKTLRLLNYDDLSLLKNFKRKRRNRKFMSCWIDFFVIFLFCFCFFSEM